MTSDKQMLQRIDMHLNAIRPMVEGHGGSLEVIKFEDGIVYIKLHGACVGCPASLFTIKLGIEESLKAAMPEVKEVVPL